LLPRARGLIELLVVIAGIAGIKTFAPRARGLTTPGVANNNA
jgi:hypothetical protein